MVWNPDGWAPSSWGPEGWGPSLGPAAAIPTFPASIYPDFQTIEPAGAQEVFASPMNIARQVLTYPGAEHWKASLGFTSLTGKDRSEMTAFCTKLRVGKNHFLMVNHAAPQQGVLAGSPVVAIESVSGSVLPVFASGQTSVTDWAKAGDYISVNSELKMVLDSVDTDGLDVASLSIWPPLRQSPSSGDVVVVSSPVGAFRLLDAPTFETYGPGFKTDLAMRVIEYISSANVVNL